MAATRIITFGCRLNSYESEVMRAHAEAAGFGDAIVFNTCAVTGEAVRQARQAIRKARRENPHARIIVTGCAAQIDPLQFAEMNEVDHIIGNDEKMKAGSFAALATGDSERIAVNDIMSVRETAPHMIAGFGSRARAYVQVQNGCDHRCTFCVIPYGRGNSRSVPAGEVVTQIRQLVASGYPEIVLTGVDITSYGPDLPGSMTLGKLVQAILREVPELARLRLSSIDSIEADKALMQAISDEPRLMPHLHLSLQAGDDLTLKRMKRRHLRADSVRFCQEVRALRPDMLFGADLIAGFPTETEQMFAGTLSIIEECGLTFLHIFPFSPRPNTPAARMPQLPRAVVKERAARLRAAADTALTAYLARQRGSTVSVLMETAKRGRTAQFAELELDRHGRAGDTEAGDIEAGDIKAGDMVQARVTGNNATSLIGEMVT